MKLIRFASIILAILFAAPQSAAFQVDLLRLLGPADLDKIQTERA